jgi:hypothetical protein
MARITGGVLIGRVASRSCVKEALLSKLAVNVRQKNRRRSITESPQPCAATAAVPPRHGLISLFIGDPGRPQSHRRVSRRQTRDVAGRAGIARQSASALNELAAQSCNVAVRM